MFWFILKNKLSAYIHGELDKKTSARIAKFIESNEKCKRDYEIVKAGVQLGEQLNAKELPTDPWLNIKSNLEDERKIIDDRSFERPKQYTRPAIVFPLAGAVIAVILLFVIYGDNSFTTNTTINFDRYMTNIEANQQDGTLLRREIAAIPTEFRESEVEFALRSASIFDFDNNSPLDGFELQSHSVILGEEDWQTGVQLSYRRGDDMFSVFVSRHNFTWDFGHRNASDETLMSMNIARIEMNGANAYYHNIGEKQFLLVSTFDDRRAVETILQYMRRAYYSIHGQYFSEPSWFPDGMGLMFTSLRDFNSEIYEKRFNDDRLINITRNDSEDASPEMSPDMSRQRFMFSSNRSGSFDLYLFELANFSTTRITELPGDEMNSSWNPDGTHVLFDTGNDDNNRDIVLLNVESKEQIVLVDDDFDNSNPAWSPDGASFVFNSNRDGNYEIYVMDFDGRQLTKLTENTSRDIFPSWSPDGLKIVFSSNRSGSYQIYSMNRDGSEQRSLTSSPPHKYSPVYSPDGSQIAFAMRDNGGKIYIMNADGSDITRFTTKN